MKFFSLATWLVNIIYLSKIDDRLDRLETKTNGLIASVTAGTHGGREVFRGPLTQETIMGQMDTWTDMSETTMVEINVDGNLEMRRDGETYTLETFNEREGPYVLVIDPSGDVAIESAARTRRSVIMFDRHGEAECPCQIHIDPSRPGIYATDSRQKYYASIAF